MVGRAISPPGGEIARPTIARLCHQRQAVERGRRRRRNGPTRREPWSDQHAPRRTGPATRRHCLRLRQRDVSSQTRARNHGGRP
eukprot:9217939-Lingulodinium_polyedra.AAC.1